MGKTAPTSRSSGKRKFLVVRVVDSFLFFTNLFPARMGERRIVYYVCGHSCVHPLAVRFTFTKRLDGARARGGFLPSSEVDSSVFTPMSPPLP